MKIVAMVMSREQSTRLPNKALADIEGKPMLQRVVDRVRYSHWVDETVVITMNTSPQIISYCQDNGIGVFAYDGDDDDIIARTYYAAIGFKADYIVRVWGDCPLIDPEIIDLVVNDHMSYGYDYTYNLGHPKGLNCAVISFELLKYIHEELTDPDDRIFFQRHLCKQGLARALPHHPDLSYVSLCVDDARDLDFIRWIYRQLGDRIFLMNDILELSDVSDFPY